MVQYGYMCFRPSFAADSAVNLSWSNCFIGCRTNEKIFKSTDSESRQQNQVHRNDRMILRFKRNREGIETWDDWFDIES